jgi:hypothetical protein
VKAHLDVLRNNVGLNPCNPMSSSKYKLMQHVYINININIEQQKESKKANEGEKKRERGRKRM